MRLLFQIPTEGDIRLELLVDSRPAGETSVIEVGYCLRIRSGDRKVEFFLPHDVPRLLELLGEDQGPKHESPDDLPGRV